MKDIFLSEAGWKFLHDRHAGMNYQQIADKYNVTRQYVHQEIGGIHFGTVTGARVCVYPALRGWMMDNDVDRNQIADATGIPSSTLYRVFGGHQDWKGSQARAVMEFTGLTWEQITTKGDA